MKARYTGRDYFPYLTHGKIYPVLNIERGWYRILTDLDDDYLYPPTCFTIAEGGPEEFPEDKPENWWHGSEGGVRKS